MTKKNILVLLATAAIASARATVPMPEPVPTVEIGAMLVGVVYLLWKRQARSR